jgi:hypothetical protein
VDFHPNGGIGLYLDEGSASFKDVGIETRFDNQREP